MELAAALRRRRMVRAFDATPVDAAALDRVLDAGRRAPSAGHSQGWAFVVLEGADTARYWDVTLPAAARATFAWPGLLAAPVLVLPCARPAAYVARYAEPDKARTGLGAGEDAWPVPYWFVDTGMAAMAMLLAAVDEGLGACFFGLFDHEAAVKDALAIPAAVRPVGAIALGHPAPGAERPGRSAPRGRRPLAEVVHRGGWSGPAT
jgi:nitroreductase